MAPVSDTLLDLDAKAAEAVLPLRDSRAHVALGWVAKGGDQPQLRALCAGLLALGWVRRDRRMARAAAEMLAAHELATLAKSLVKSAVIRRRPRALDDDLDALKPRLGHDPAKEESSFPSGHSAGAAAVARAFARAYPNRAGAAYGAAGIAALVQIPRSAHYPSDVGAGLAIGVAAEAATAFLFRRLAGRAGAG